MKTSLKICVFSFVLLPLIFSLWCMADEPGDNTDPEICQGNVWVNMDLDPNEPEPEFAPIQMDVNEPEPEIY